MGTANDRSRYIEVLRILCKSKGDLSKESQDTFVANPLRVLDSKRDEDAQVIAEAHSILDHLSTKQTIISSRCKKVWKANTLFGGTKTC